MATKDKPPRGDAADGAPKKTNRTTPAAGKSRAHPSRSGSRRSRESADVDRESEGLTVDAKMREALLRDEALQHKLPNPPKRTGWHYFWASTQNSYNPISWYKQLGYRVVNVSEMEQWADASRRGTGGEYDGAVCINEMVLMKIDEKSYQQIMRVIHHDKPNEEGKRLRESIDGVKDEVGTDGAGASLVTEVTEGGVSGYENVDRVARRPRSFEG